MNPRQLSTNLGHSYERPITITDETVDAQYKIIFAGGTGPGGYIGVVMDTGWQIKADLHSIIDNGIMVGNNIPASGYGSLSTLGFTIDRKTYTGVESQIANGSLLYSFLPSPRLFHVSLTRDTFYTWNPYSPALQFYSNASYTLMAPNEYTHIVASVDAVMWVTYGADVTITGHEGRADRVSLGFGNSGQQWTRRYNDPNGLALWPRSKGSRRMTRIFTATTPWGVVIKNQVS